MRFGWRLAWFLFVGGAAFAQSPRGLAFLDSPESIITDPPLHFTFSRGEIPLDLDARPEMFDPVRAGQEVEAMDVALRGMVRSGRSQTEIGVAIEKIARWERQVDRLRVRYASGGVNALEALARQSSDIRVLARCATRWVQAVEVERAEMLSTIAPWFRGESNAMVQVRVNPRTYAWAFPKSYPWARNTLISVAFPKAQTAIQRALAVNPKDAESLFAEAMLLRRQDGATLEDSLALARRAAQSTGPYAAAAHVFVLETDNLGPYQLEARADWLRNVQRGPSTSSVQDTPSHSYTPGEYVSPGNTVKGGTVYVPMPHWTPGPIIHVPTARDIAEANALEAKAKQIRANMRAEEDNVIEQNPRDVEMFLILATYNSERRFSDSVLRYALLLDPSDYRLHWLRDARFTEPGKPQSAVAEASDYAQWFLRKGYADDWGHCSSYALQLHKKYKDPFISYVLASHCMHLNPTRPAGHLDLVVSFMKMRPPFFAGSFVSGALEQGRLESEVMYQIGARLLEHPDEWPSGTGRADVIGLMGFAKCMRGEYARLLHRYPEARECYTEALSLNPRIPAAEKGLSLLPP